jgi:4-hydroxybenzoate polyprenyltransferase
LGELTEEPVRARRRSALAAELRAAAKILFSVGRYRLRKREMANFAGALSVMLVLGLAWREVLLRVVAVAGMNLLVYLHNDYLDLPADLASCQRRGPETAFLAAHRRAALLAQALLVAVLAAVGSFAGWGVLLAIAAALGPVLLYSARGKRVPFADVALIALGATGLGMVAAPLDSVLGWCFAVQLGLLAGCFQLIQALRDLRDDASFGIRTTAVVLGVDRTVLLLRACMLLTALFAAAALHRWWGLTLVVAVLLPYRKQLAERYWNQVRLLFGASWLLLIGSVALQGRASGWLLGACTSDRLGWLSFLAQGWTSP